MPPLCFSITDSPGANCCLRCEGKEVFFKAEMKKELTLLNIQPHYKGCVLSPSTLPRDAEGTWKSASANGAKLIRRRQRSLTSYL